MKFGEKGIKKCKTCGNDFEGFNSSKYCKDGCKPQGRIHKKKVKEEVKEDETGNKSSIITVGGHGIGNIDHIENDKPQKAEITETKDKNNTPQTTPNEINSIQIIDSKTGKAAKHWTEKLIELAFSEQYAPITTALIGGIAARLQKPNNDTQDGMLTAEDGSKHEMI